MSVAEAFHDTNVVLYLRSGDAAKADRAEELFASGGSVSVQVLNEFAAVARRQLRMDWSQIHEVLLQLRAVCVVESLSVETHARGVMLAERYKLNVYDAMIDSSALLAGCRFLYTEDMHDGQVFEGQLTVRNPFAA